MSIQVVFTIFQKTIDTIYIGMKIKYHRYKLYRHFLVLGLIIKINSLLQSCGAKIMPMILSPQKCGMKNMDEMMAAQFCEELITKINSLLQSCGA
jgi:hypothetical protein